MFYPFIRPWLFRLDPEQIHHHALALMEQPWFPTLLHCPSATRHPSLEKKLWGLTFPNPMGLAAGFDKNAVALLAWERLGFGYVEMGTVTRHAQPGNPRPRIFRLPAEHALINRMGFPNLGADAMAKTLEQAKNLDRWPKIPVGINIGKSKITELSEAHEDYRYSCQRLHTYADYFVINVSSPNTPGLRTLQGRDQLEKIVATVQEENHRQRPKPLLVKIAPDLTEPQLDEVLQVIAEQRVDGIVATNTTLDKSAVSLKEEGGLSGAPVRNKSTDIIRLIAQKTGGQLPIMGVGGIFTAAEAREKLSAGAVLVQSYTGFIYQGPAFVKQVCEGLVS